jgi:hypothetical protein
LFTTEKQSKQKAFLFVDEKVVMGVIPAEAGVQKSPKDWIPACAGMTTETARISFSATSRRHQAIEKLISSERSDGVTCLRRVFLLFVMLASVFACAHEKLDESLVSEPYVRERWLPFIADGRTDRNEISQRLGEPTSSFQNRTILGYRLILVEEGRDISEKEYRNIILNRESGYLAGYFGWVNDRRKLLSEKGTLFIVREQNKKEKLLDILSREAEYSLVLVFDDQGKLARHNLRRIMP